MCLHLPFSIEHLAFSIAWPREMRAQAVFQQRLASSRPILVRRDPLANNRLPKRI
jgi:hypothetical protein